MAQTVEFLIKATYDGKGFTAAVVSAEKLDVAQKKVTASGEKLASTVGRVSTTLARSVGVFGLSSSSLRALDDAADIAELGLRGVEGGFKGATTMSAVFTSAAGIGAVGAALALGAGLGTLLRQLGETEFGMKVLGLSTKELDADFRRLFGTIAAGPDKDFAAEMAASNAAAVQTQIQSLRQAGASIDDIAKTSGDALKRMLAPLAESDKIAKLKELGFSTAEITKLVPALTDNLKGETDAQKAAAAAAKEHAEELKRLAEEAFKLFEKEALSASMEAEEKLLEDVEKAAEELEKQFQALEEAALDAAMAAEEWELDQELEETEEAARRAEEELRAMREEAERMADVKLSAMLEGLVNLVGLFGEAWADAGSIIADTVMRIDEAATSTEKAVAVMRGVGQIGGMIGGKAGNVIGGAAGGAMAGFAIGGPWGAAIGGVVGGFLGLFKSGKQKAEELKKKQAEAANSWSSMFDEWQQLRSEIAGKGADAVNSMLEGMFDEDGKFNASLTSAANAGAYVAAQFNVLRASGLSASQALAKLGPSLKAMGEDAKKFAGTAAAPLLKMAQFAEKNEKLIAFTESLGQLAVSLASFGQLTQDLANKISTDMGNAIDQQIAKGLTYSEALGLNAQALFDLQQAAAKSGVALDAQTQKMITDAQTAGLFEGLQDPMQKLIQLQGAMVAAMGQLIQLFGGAVPAAIQKMIDEFNNAQISVTAVVTVPGQPGGPGGGGVPAEPGIPPKPQPMGFSEGGYLPERAGGHNIRVGETGTGGEYMVPAKKLASLLGNAAPINITIVTRENQSPQDIAEETMRRLRINRRGSLSQNTLGYR